MMHMTFYWSRQVTLLFDSWKTDSWTSYALTLLACLLASVFYQYLEDLRIRLKLLKPSSAEQPLLSSNTAKFSKAAKVGGAALFGFNSAIGYLLMLAIMSFNGGVFLAIVGGLSAGYLFFRSGGDDAAMTVDNPCACA